MATTHDIADLKAQFDDRISHLRESFGVVEGDISRLGHFTQDFVFSSLEEHQKDNNDINQAKNDLHDKAASFVSTVAGDEATIKTQFDALQHMLTDGQSQLDTHIQQHDAAHGILADASHGFAANIEQVIGEVTHAQGEYVNHVQDMHSTLTGLAEKVFGAATAADHSVKEAQTEALNQAATAFHALMDSHLNSHLPTNFQETVQQLTQHVHDLGEHATTAGNNLHNEVATLLHDLQDFATHEVHDKIEAKFQHLMEEALAFLMQEILETIVVTTTGVATTAAMSEIIPVLAVLKHALDALKEAIKIFKTLEEIF